MLLPHKPESAAKRPSLIQSYQNGQLPSNVLEPCGIRSFVLEREAARSMRALIKKAWRDGIRLSATGTYRSYDGQVNLFLRRYDNIPRNTRHEFWRGKNWWLKTNWNGQPVAGAAVPGTSNHGLGLAVDFSVRNMLGQEKPLSVAALNWLSENGPSFGWWNTTETENWHWCWCLGDGPMPAAVLAEEGHYPNPEPPVALPTLKVGDSGDNVKTLQMKLTKIGATLLVDGQFGPRTESAVKAFQTASALPVTGMVDTATWTALNKK